MRISSRSRKILEVLLSSNHDLTAAQIAAEIQVSARTVHRELALLETFLQHHGVKLLKKSGLGIRLEGEKNALNRLAQFVSVSEEIELTPRRTTTLFVMCSSGK